jgi:hypothetical protein
MQELRNLASKTSLKGGNFTDDTIAAWGIF